MMCVYHALRMIVTRKLDNFLRSWALDEVMADMELVAVSLHPQDTSQWLVHVCGVGYKVSANVSVLAFTVCPGKSFGGEGM